jgi:glycosyltransferase involved in cell wall biosynthesis
MLDGIAFGLAGLLVVGYLLTTIEFAIGNRSIVRLGRLALPTQAQWRENLPTVSIIIPARNEERHIEEALTSVLHLDYPEYELVVLNDRSEDRTGEILTSMQQRYPQLRVVTIQDLPPGWLGKNYALYTGAQSATGEWLLFTDADIVMTPDALTRAVAYALQAKLDHLAVMPDIHSRPLALNLFIPAFSIYFSLYARPWFAGNAKIGSHIGIGAFNLIRKSAYEAIGTHQAIALRPDDDMKLGKLVKKHGFRQAAANGMDMLQVEWYASLGELIQGLTKNAFAGLNYSLLYMLFGITAQFLFGVWPVIAVCITHGMTQLLYGLVVLLMQVLCWDHARYHRLNPWSGLVFPLSTLVMIYIIVRATALNLWHQGIRWRGTHYPLDELKANRV